VPLFPLAPLRLHVHGAETPRPLDGLATLTVDATGVTIVPLDAALMAGQPERIAFPAIRSIAMEGDQGALTIALRAGGAYTASGDARVAEVMRAADVHGRAMPELARALRALGGRHGGAGQHAFFAPLLDARREANAGGDAALAAFDADALRARFEGEVERLAAEREPARAPARRALHARLCEAVEPLLDALVPLTEAAVAARSQPSAVPLAAWSHWCALLQRVFERADAAWIAVDAVLAAHRPSEGPPRPARSALTRFGRDVR